MDEKITAQELRELPFLIYADSSGRIFEHPHLRMMGLSGTTLAVPASGELMPMPEYSKLFFLPDCPPLGINPETGDVIVLTEAEGENGSAGPCFAVAAFPEPGFVRTFLPAADYTSKEYILPTWAYTAVGFMEDHYVIAAFRVEANPKWDPRNYDDDLLVPAIGKFRNMGHRGPLTDHLASCATVNHCFAAKNLFLGRWEAPLPVSRRCNATCLGCLSLQPANSCQASHHRIDFRPSRDEIVSIAVGHLERAPEAMVSFGQGCEGEPLTEYRLIAESIRGIRKKTRLGTINLNTNGSWPDRLKAVIESGLDSVRISLNSARADLY
ncbi:MAG: radical SAM protein, partial [Desulfobacteraceae bacterium]